MQGTWVSLSLFWFCTSYGARTDLFRDCQQFFGDPDLARPEATGLSRGYGTILTASSIYVDCWTRKPVRLQRQPSGSTMQGTWVSLSLFWFCTSYGRHTAFLRNHVQDLAPCEHLQLLVRTLMLLPSGGPSGHNYTTEDNGQFQKR